MNSMFKSIFDCSPVAMILVDENSEIQMVNKCAEVLFEYNRKELIGASISLLVPQELRPKHPSLVKGYFQSSSPRKMGIGRNLYGIRKDQTKFPVEVGLNPIMSEGRTFVMSSVIDMTERVSAEERFRSAVNAAPNGMIMINSKGVITLANKKTEDIFGYDEGELINNPIEMLVPAETKVPHPTFVKNYVNNPAPRSMGVGRELFGMHKSGKLVPVEIGLQPITFQDETFVISSIVDISHRREVEKQIEIKSDEIKEFSYRTSHDLKSPLLTIGGLVDYIIEDIENGDVESSLKGVHKVKALTLKLNRLIDDILTLTKSDLQNEETDVFKFPDYLKDAKDKFELLFQDNKIEIHGTFLHKKDLVAQKTRLTQVLDNLISNAAKYCDTQKSPYIRINTFNDAENFYIQVEDNGIGIPKEKQDDVFGMFKRFHEGKIEGSGLGLYMVKKHAQKMNSKINYESSKDGTVFYLEFPMEQQG